MRYFSMFSGIGGFELGIQKVHPGWKCIGYSEIDKRAIKIYEKHFPTHKNYGDATKIIPEQLPNFNLLVGGFPCQSFSIAGKRGGFNDTRGTLFFDIARIVRVKKPSLLLLENVKGLLSHDGGRTFDTIIRTLDGLGYDCEWALFYSTDFGRPQSRPRVYIYGTLRKGKEQTYVGKGDKQKTPILFECKKRFRNTDYNWEKISRMSTRIIRDYAGISIGLDGGITKNGEEISIGERTDS